MSVSRRTRLSLSSFSCTRPSTDLWSIRRKKRPSPVRVWVRVRVRVRVWVWVWVRVSPSIASGTAL